MVVLMGLLLLFFFFGGARVLNIVIAFEILFVCVLWVSMIQWWGCKTFCAYFLGTVVFESLVALGMMVGVHRHLSVRKTNFPQSMNF